MISTPSACIVAEKEKVAKVVLMPGDPLRAKYIAEKYLENPDDVVCIILCASGFSASGWCCNAVLYEHLFDDGRY